MILPPPRHKFELARHGHFFVRTGFVEGGPCFEICSDLSSAVEILKKTESLDVALEAIKTLHQKSNLHD